MPGVQYVAGFDLGLRRDRSALIIAHREYLARDSAPPIDFVVVDCVRHWIPADGQPLSFDQVVAEASRVCRRYNDCKLYRDNFSGDAVGFSLGQRGTRSIEVPMTAPAQVARFEHMASKLRTGSLRLVDHERLVRELTDLRIKLHQAGRVSIAAPAKKQAHDDLADALAIAVEAAGKLAPAGDISCELRARVEPGAVQLRREWFKVQRDVLGNETRVPCLAPRGTPDWQQAQRERLARGLAIPEDFEELGGDPFSLIGHKRGPNMPVIG